MNLRDSWRAMRATLPLLVFLATLCFGHGSPTERLPTERSPTDFSIPFDATEFRLTGRIVNGTKALIAQFPHQVSLIRSWSQRHFCGGAIISPSLVLTAGHCMYLSRTVLEPWMVMVVGGIINLNDRGLTRQQRKIENVIVHPNFDIDNLYNDVAILKLETPFEFTLELHSVPLAGNTPEANTVCQISGWGYQSSDFPITLPDLMYVDLPIRGTDECRNLLKNVTDLPPGMFCAGYLEGGRDACQGDSGGGMVCDGILTGLVSGGEGCAEPLLPGVYADVFHYLDWIVKTIEVETVWVVEKRSTGDTETGGNYGTSNTSSAMVIIISFFFVLLSTVTSRP